MIMQISFMMAFMWMPQVSKMLCTRERSTCMISFDRHHDDESV